MVVFVLAGAVKLLLGSVLIASAVKIFRRRGSERVIGGGRLDALPWWPRSKEP